MEHWIQILLLSLLGSIMGLVGGIVLLYNKKVSSTLENYSIPFAAGVLITVAIVGLLPESIEMAGEGVLMIVLISFFGAYLFEHLFFSLHHHDDKHEHHHHNYKASVPLVIFGDTIHNFIDGFAIGASFIAAPGLGLITAFSTFLHEVPHEIGDFGILYKAGWKKINIVIVNIISAAVTILAAFLSLSFAGNESLLGSLLAVSAGVFLYLGTVDFLPHALGSFKSKPKGVIALIAGIVIMILTLMLVPHVH